MEKVLLSASVMCANVLNLGEALREIEQSGIDMLHCDVMDNHFVPNLMLPPEMLNKLRVATSIPFDYHLMVTDPYSVFARLDVREGDMVSFHYESGANVDELISAIKAKKAKACIAISPETPITAVEKWFDKLDVLLVMTVRPGFAGQPLYEGSMEKISLAKKYADVYGFMIQVDGNCSFENCPVMVKNGANILVVGTSSVFKKGQTIKEGVDKLTKLLCAEEE